MAGAFILPAFNLHAAQKQPGKIPLTEKTPDKEGQKIYKTLQFFQSETGAFYSTIHHDLYDNGGLEIKLERENILTPHGKYTVADYLFEGDWGIHHKKNPAIISMLPISRHFICSILIS